MCTAKILIPVKRSGRQAFESSCYVEWTEIYAAGFESMQARRDTQLSAAAVEDSAKDEAVLTILGEQWVRMRVRTDPPAKRWMRVSRSPITIAQPSLFCSLLLQFVLSVSLTLSMSVSVCGSVHPISTLARSIQVFPHLLIARKAIE